MNNLKKRNFLIEPFKHMVVADARYAENTWKILEHAIQEIFNHNSCSLSFEELYRHAYHMVLNKCGDKLYTGLVATMTNHLKGMAKSLEAAQEDMFLEELNRKWNDHNKAMQIICGILMYLDRTYIRSSCKTHIHELGQNLWRDNIVHCNTIQAKLLAKLNDLILKERSTREFNYSGLIRKTIMMLMELGPSVYQEDFEKPFLDVSAEFYRGESQRFIEFCDCGDYLKKVDGCLKEELDRAARYLDVKSEAKITNVVEREMIANPMLRIVHMENSGLVNMLLDDKYEDLGRMYCLFHRVPTGHSTICEVMTSHIRETGTKLVTDPERSKDPVLFVQRLLDEKDKYDRIISTSFNNHKTFLNGLKSSFEHFINLNPRLPEFISLFVDDKLRKGLKGVNEEDIEIILDKVMVLFHYVNEKDVFEKYYKQHLAKRLLSCKTVFEDAERNLIVKLKTVCGYQFTSILEGMFKDMKTSQDIMQRFYSSHPELAGGPTLNVQVLTTGSWPTQPRVTCNLPAEMSALCDKFRSYYLGIHNGRRLSWKTNMGTADIKAIFGNKRKHELNVSTHQMCVLMLFNNANRLNYKEIEQSTEIPASDLKRCLQSLACVKGKNVLQKEPIRKDIGENDAFFVNDKFASKFYKLKIGTVSAQKESEPEKQETRRMVEEDRRTQIDAAIVRVMKTRKTLDHNNVIAEVTKQLQSRFLANPMQIKKRIESLIEQEYLERDAADMKLYHYLA